nr:Chain A, salt-resistant antimicrobial peptide RR12 [synthetic construct]
RRLIRLILRLLR